MPVIPVLRRLRQEDQEFQVNLGSMERKKRIYWTTSLLFLLHTVIGHGKCENQIAILKSLLGP
jgi:hypothetical protein